MKILIAILIFSVIIIFHELGHFLLAKRNGIKVTEFSLGMGPRLLSTQKGETRYSLKLFPIGGSCMMVGEDDDDDSEGSFNKASVWARISVVAAGPIFNFILAFVFAMIITSVAGMILLVYIKGRRKFSQPKQDFKRGYYYGISRRSIVLGRGLGLLYDASWF